MYNISWNNLSKKIPPNYDNLAVPEIKKITQNMMGTCLGEKIYNYLISEYNKGKNEGILESLYIQSCEGKTKGIHYQIKHDKINLKLVEIDF